MRENESDAAAHTFLVVSFPGKKGILTKKDGITAKKRVGDLCARLVPSRLVSKTTCFLSSQKQPECMQSNREDSRSRSTPVYFLPPPTAIVT
ncbi:MAG: hypothetical protein WAK17_08645 [Candidatus Nitrosopolaris sp.]